MKLKIFPKLSLHSKHSAMRNVCASSEIRRMTNTIHVIFTNVIHDHVKGIEPLTSEVKGSDLYVIQRTYK